MLRDLQRALETVCSLSFESCVVWLVAYDCAGSIVSHTLHGHSDGTVRYVLDLIESFAVQLTN